MIRRRGDNAFLLIAQHDHAALSGKLAEHFGGRLFARPHRYDEFILACSHHDSGWPLHDDNPTLNKGGLPLDVFETPLPLAIRLWTASADRVQKEGLYAGLLVSMHVMGLSSHAAANPHTPAEIFELNKFQHNEAERQLHLRGALGLRTDIPLKFGVPGPGKSEADDALAFSFGLLQAVDRMSLGICCTELLFPRIEALAPRPGRTPLALQMQRPSDTELTIDPWPFAVSSLNLEVTYRAVPAHPMTSVEQFRAAYRAAQPEMLYVLVRPAP